MAYTHKKEDRIKTAAQMELVRARYGIGYLRQFYDFFLFCRKKHNLDIEEYYRFGLYRPELSKDQKRSFLGFRGTKRVLDKLNSRRNHSFPAILDDKLVFAKLVSELGFLTPHLQGYYGQTEIKIAPMLRSKNEVLDFLTTKAVYPIFCKPRFGSLGIDSVQIDSVSPDGKRVTLRGGDQMDADAFFSEIIANHPKGYLFQSVLQQTDELAGFYGQTPVVFRVMTVKENDRNASLLYVFVRAAPPDSMAVIDDTKGRYNTVIDPETGKAVGGLWPVAAPFSTKFRDETDIGVHRDEIQVTGIRELCDVAVQIHNYLGFAAILGYDCILTENGPVVLEANARPSLSTLQRLLDTGFLSDDFDPRVKSILSELRD